MRDLFNHVNPVPAVAPKAAIVDDTAFVGAIIDRQGYESLTYLMITGTDADADATFAVTLEEGDDPALADTAQVAASDVLGTLALAGYTFADDGVCRKLGYVGNKRYTRLTVTPANNTGNAFLGVIALLGRPADAPTANPPA